MRARFLLLALAATAGLSGCGGAGRELDTVSSDQPITVNETRYEVQSAKKADQLQNRYQSVSPKGVFVLVTLKVTNAGKQGRPFDEGLAKLVTADGKLHEPDPIGSGMVDMRDHLLGEGVSKGHPRTGTIVFDIPPRGLGGARLRVRDLSSPDHGFVQLKL